MQRKVACAFLAPNLIQSIEQRIFYKTQEGKMFHQILWKFRVIYVIILFYLEYSSEDEVIWTQFSNGKFTKGKLRKKRREN